MDHLKGELFDYTVDQDNEDRIIQQLSEYLVEYENTQNPVSLWFVYLMLNSIEDKYILFNDSSITKLNVHTNINDLFSCIKKADDEKVFDVLASLFSYCTNYNSIKLAHLHNLNSNDNDYNIIINSINPNNLNDKELLHYNYLTTGFFSNNYVFDINHISLLDFYLIDKATNIIDFSNIDPFVNELSNYLFEKQSLNEINDKLKFLIVINALYKLEREYDVYKNSKVLTYFDNIPVSNEFLRILNYISFSSHLYGFYQYDIDLYRNFILPVSTLLSKKIFLINYIDYGTAVHRIGNTNYSLNIFKYVYDNKEYIIENRYYGFLLNNLAIAYLNIGYFERYVELQLQALTISSENNDIISQIYFLNNLYIYHRKLQNWHTASEFLNKTRKLSIESEDKALIAESNISLATFHRDFNNDIPLSIQHIQEAIRIAEKINNYEILINAKQQYANTYIINNDEVKAIEALQRVADTAQDRNDIQVAIYSYARMAEIYLNTNIFNKAYYYIKKIKEYDISMMSYPKMVEIQTIIANYHFSKNETDTAFSILSTLADEIIRRSIHSSDIQSGHIYLANEFLSLFELFIEHLVGNNLIHEAIFWMDEIKNLSSVTFYNNPALKSSILSENELVLDFALGNRIERLRSEIRTASDDKRIELNSLLLNAVSQQNVLRRKVLQNIDFEPVNLNRLRRQLGRSDIIFYFSIFNDDLYVTSITSGSFNIQKITFSDEDFNRIEDIVMSLSTDKVRLTELAWLKNKVFGDNSISDRYTNYFIIPDGFLYNIPFEIFPIQNVSSDYSYGEATYLIEHAAISYSNSLKDLKASLNHRPQRTYPLDFVGFGITHFNNPQSQLMPGRYLPALPLAEREVKDISSSLNIFNNNTYFDSKTATEKNLRKNSGNSRILHFATHSEVFENDPLYSVIYLNREEGENQGTESSNDGFVYAYELFQMDLSSEMVMLNSCESGSGNYIQGSGIVGFSRAFNYAGIPSMVMNLWSVRDRSAYHLSVSFYDYLNQGYSKSEAMRKAKIHYINKFNSNPANWGSFVIYGNIDPIVPSRNPWILVTVFLVIGGISLILTWLWLPAKIRRRLH